MPWNYKNIAVRPEDYDRLTHLANGMPLGRTISLILDTLESNGLRVVDIVNLPAPEGCEEVPLVTVEKE